MGLISLLGMIVPNRLRNGERERGGREGEREKGRGRGGTLGRWILRRMLLGGGVIFMIQLAAEPKYLPSFS